MAIRQQRAERTVQGIVREFRRSFLETGFAAATTDAVLDRLQISKGALYHHFASKTEIMAAVFERESVDAIQFALDTVRENGPALQRLKFACIAWLSRVRSRDTALILFDIGPSALGYRRARQIEDANSLQHFVALLREAQEKGETRIGNIELTARMLSAIVAEAALHELREGRDVSGELEAAIEGLLKGMDKSVP